MVNFSISETHLQVLKEDLKKSNKAAFAAGTRRNLRIQWESFLLFCHYFNFISAPVSTITLQLYSQFLSRSFRSVDSIKNYINGVKTMHLMMGHSVDHINKFVLNLSLRGIGKLNPHCVKQAEAMTPEMLIKIYSVLDLRNKFDMVIWCLFLFAFFLLARKSNLVPTSNKDLKSGKFLLRRDVLDLGNHLIISFRWTKTIQRGERLLQLPLLNIEDSILCPVTAYRNMCKAIPAPDHCALFLLPNKKTITYAQFQNKLKYCVQKLGLDPQNFSTHSFRRGGASLAFRAKIPADKIKLMGDWKSDCYQRYLTFELEDKISVQNAMKQYMMKHSLCQLKSK